MTAMMETIQNVAVAYQTNGTAADNTSKKVSAEKKEARAPRVSIRQPERMDTVAEGDEKAAEKVQVSEKVSDSALKKAVEEINRQSSSTEAIFGYHEGTNRVTIKIIDKETREVKKEYPAEETLDMIQKIWETAGLMVDAKG